MSAKAKQGSPLRDAILSKEDVVIEPLVIPEWGGITVYVRTMSSGDQGKFRAQSMRKIPTADPNVTKEEFDDRFFTEKLAVYTVCDEEGNLVFTPEDIPELAKKSAVVMQRIFEVAARLNGLREKDVEAAAKN
jgi:hypothetical protein